MKRLIIQKSKWGPNWLRSKRTGKMCCLGFWCLAEGATEDQITGYEMPGDVSDSLFAAVGKPTKLTRAFDHKCWHEDAANANDNYFSVKSPKKKAEHLKEIRAAMKEGGYQVVIRND